MKDFDFNSGLFSNTKIPKYIPQYLIISDLAGYFTDVEQHFS